MQFLRWALICVFLATHLDPAQSQQARQDNSPSSSALKKYLDPITGVSFRYPNTWLLNQGGGAYFTPVILRRSNEDSGNPYYKPTGYVLLVGRDAKQGPYSNSNFINGWFLYRVAPDLTEEQCYAQAGTPLQDSNESDNWKLDWRTINGVRFRYGTGTDQGLCNETSEDVYAAFHGGHCYLFEKQINTTCPGSGLRDITPRELDGINQQFGTVMFSVRFASAVTSANLPSVQTTEPANGVAVAAVKVLFVASPQPPPPPSRFGEEGGLPSDALYPRGSSHPNYHGSFAGLVTQKISTVTVTRSNPKRFKTHLQTEKFLLELLSNAKTETYGFHIWSNVELTPCLTAAIDHVAGSQGRLMVWCNDPIPADPPRREYPTDGGLKWAYQDGSGNWWWAAWGSGVPLPESMGTVTGKTLQIQVPRKLKTIRNPDALLIGCDRDSFQPVRLTVNEKLTTGIRSEMRVYPADAPRPAQPDSVEVSNGTDFNQIGGMLRVKDRNFPVLGKPFVMELDMTIFETPVAAQHMWDSAIGTNYRILWQRTMRQTIE